MVYRNTFLLSLNLEDWIQQQLYFLGDYEKEEIDFLLGYLKPGGSFADIGANIGLFTLNGAKAVGKEGCVYSFEPLPSTFQKLREHISINHLSNVYAINAAVSDCNGTQNIYYNESLHNIGMASAFSDGTPFRVESITFDHFVENNNITCLDVVKIDIEGAEMQALNGMERTLKKYKPVLIMEINTIALKSSGSSEQEVLNKLVNLNYRKIHTFTRSHSAYNAVFEIQN